MPRRQPRNCPSLLAKLLSRRFAFGATPLPSFWVNIWGPPTLQARKEKGRLPASRSLQQIRRTYKETEDGKGHMYSEHSDTLEKLVAFQRDPRGCDWGRRKWCEQRQLQSWRVLSDQEMGAR